MAAVVRFEGVGKRFGNFSALSDVSFEIPERSLFGLLGPNGAGKTTLFSIAAGFVRPSEGKVEVLSTPVERISELRGRFSMLPQDASFQAGIPLIDQLVMFAQLNGMNKQDGFKASMDALHMVGLSAWAKRTARVLSHGMAKRVALCQAFLGKPEVIFLDEPTAGLDPENARKIRELILVLSKENTVILSSHNLAEIQEICDHACILNKGKVCLNGPMSELTSAGKIFRIRLGEESPALVERLVANPHIAKVEATSSRDLNLHLDFQEARETRDLMKFLYQTFMDLDVYPTSIQEGGSLESIFLQSTGGTFDGGSST